FIILILLIHVKSLFEMVSEYNRNGDTQSMYEESETDNAEGKEEEYVVEKVLDHRVNDNTWEDEENMYVQFVFALKLLKAKDTIIQLVKCRYAKDLIEEYWQKRNNSKKSNQKGLSKLEKQLTNSTKKTTNASQQKTARKRKYMEQDVH
ncbi:10840_t:CDS:2, partial [Racocetra fulgida]